MFDYIIISFFNSILYFYFTIYLDHLKDKKNYIENLVKRGVYVWIYFFISYFVFSELVPKPYIAYILTFVWLYAREKIKKSIKPRI